MRCGSCEMCAHVFVHMSAGGISSQTVAFWPEQKAAPAARVDDVMFN